MLALAIIIIAFALVFDFINGFHDAANSIATVVSTRVLSPRYAVLWAAFFNFIAFLIFSTHVANTIGTRADILGAIAAIAWPAVPGPTAAAASARNNSAMRRSGSQSASSR